MVTIITTTHIINMVIFLLVIMANVCYAVSGASLAAGSHDRHIYIFDCSTLENTKFELPPNGTICLSNFIKLR
jgi:hypothetical protein